MGTSQNVRLFVGVRISVASAEALAEAAGELQEGARAEGLAIRWVPPANYHITLKFLGWTNSALIGALGDEMPSALVGAGPFEIGIAGLGAFPKPERARVLWAGVRDPEGRLADLAARVEGAAERLGFAREARAFHAHVTLARLKRPAGAKTLLENGSEREFSASWVDSVVLFESEMKSTGSEYVPRAVWPLEGPGSAPERQT